MYAKVNKILLSQMYYPFYFWILTFGKKQYINKTFKINYRITLNTVIMEYRYNYKFLQSWMTENNISNRRVLDCIGTQDNKSMNAWKNGERPMPVETILRVCNTFSIPLACFFFDMDDDTPQQIRRPQSKEEYEPIGGYPKDSERGNRQNVNPAPRFHQKTHMPAEYPSMPVSSKESPKEEKSDDNNAPDNGNQTPAPIPTPTINENDTENIALLKMELKCQQEIMRIKDEARAHETAMRTEFIKRNEKLREKLYDIINSQNETIKMLNAQLAQMEKSKGGYLSFGSDLVSDNKGESAQR